MAKKSAGILLYRQTNNSMEFFLVHPGGPFWKGKDSHSWTIPKGEFEEENPFDAAKREFKEETGIEINETSGIELSPVKQKSGKIIYSWAIEKDADETAIFSNTFDLEFPPKSGRFITIPEIDKAGWFDKKSAKEKINVTQFNLIEELITILQKK
jgi:predicted NUDIX family NTP pyrophosphohydrolase